MTITFLYYTTHNQLKLLNNCPKQLIDLRNNKSNWPSWPAAIRELIVLLLCEICCFREMKFIWSISFCLNNKQEYRFRGITKIREFSEIQQRKLKFRSDSLAAWWPRWPLDPRLGTKATIYKSLKIQISDKYLNEFLLFMKKEYYF